MASALEQLEIGHLGWITAVAFSPDGRLLASGGSDQSLILWDVASGKMLQRASRVIYPQHLAFSPDSRLLVVDGDVWDVEAWEHRATLFASSPVVFTGHDTLVFSSGDRCFVEIELGGGRVLNSVPLGPKPLDCHWHSPISANGRVAVTATCRSRCLNQVHEFAIWDLASWSLRLRKRAPRRLRALRRAGITSGWEKDVEHVALSADGRRIAVTNSFWAYVCDGLSGRVRLVLFTDIDLVARFSVFSPNGEFLAFAFEGSDGAEVDLFALPGGHAVRTIRCESRKLRALAFSPDSRQLVAGGGDKVLRIWDVATGDSIGKFRAMEYEATAVSWIGNTLAVGYLDGTVRLWDPLIGETMETMSGQPKAIVQIVLASGLGGENLPKTDDGAIVESRCGSLLLLHALEDPYSGEQRMRVYSPDGGFFARLVYPRDDSPRRAEIRDVTTGENIVAARLQNCEWPDCLCLSPDGSTLATGDYDNGVFLTDARSGVPLPQPHLTCSDGEEIAWRYTPGPVSAIAFSPDGSRLFAGSSAGEIWMWELTLEKGPDWFHDEKHGIDLIFEAHNDAIRGIAFSQDGQWMATASADATVKIWRVSDWQLQATFLVLPGEENQPSERTLALHSSVETSI